MKQFPIFAALLLTLSSHLAVNAQADTRLDHLASLAAVGKSQAAESARQAYGGKVLSVDEIKDGGRTLYRVKLLLDGGRIKIVTVDGDSGQVV